MNQLITITRPARNFYVAQSKLENAGKGLFASADIEPNTLLFIAFAPLGDNGKAKQAVQQAAAAISEGEQKPIWEAEYIQLFPNDFVNHNPEKQNAESAWMGDFAVVTSTRAIAAHDEIYKDYNQTMKLIADRGFQMIDNYLNF